MEVTFKKSGIRSLKVLSLFLRLLNNNLEKKNKKIGGGGGQNTSFLSGEHNLSLPTHILRIIQYITLWSVLL